ncbi:L-threonylcarbamoyladenylate synthase [Enterococcus sp. LJL98]
METRIFKPEEIKEAAACLRAGQLVAFPTETVYGLGANARSAEAVQQVFQVKGRPSDNPLIVHVENFEQVKDYVSIFHPLTTTIVEHFWPGPLTLIFKVKPGALPSVVSAGLPTVSFRMPNHPDTLALIHEAQVPLVGPSANTSGRPSPTQSQHVYHDLHGKIAGILEGGATAIGVESTVLDLSDPAKPPMILRPGAITKEALEAILKIEVSLDPHLANEQGVPKSPGMKYKHYAPKTPAMMVGPEEWPEAIAQAQARHLRIGLFGDPGRIQTYQPALAATYVYEEDTVEAATKALFAGLRALDEADVDVIFVPTFSEVGLGVAYMNRLKKATNQQYFLGSSWISE